MFSVVIPLYNKELSIQRTIQSVLAQTYQNFEIIVVDDGSTDSSAEQVKKIRDSRIKLIQQKNQGVSAARNLGIKAAKYEWIALLDGDDTWRPIHLQEVIDMMDIFPQKKVYATSYELSNNEKVFRHTPSSNIYIVDRYFKQAIKEYIIWTSIVVIHKECFENIGYFNPLFNRGEDIEMWDRLGKNYEIVKSQKITATYRINAENRSFETSKYDITKSSIYYIDFSQVKSPDEEEYYVKKIERHCRILIRSREIKAFLLMYKKYSSKISLKKVIAQLVLE